MNKKMRWWLVALLVGVPLLAAAWWLGTPLIINRTVDEAFPHSANATIPTNMTHQEVEQVMVSLAKLDETVEEAMQATTPPVQLKTGEFRDADSSHRGSGQATIYQLPNGTRVLRFEQFQVTNGPDLRVLLSRHPAPTSRGDLEARGYIELDRLKGNIGDQNYVIPEGTDVAAQQSVVIYCRPFHVVFSVAQLQDVDQ